MVLPDIKNADGDHAFGTVDALVALTSQGELLLSVVHRGTTGPTSLVVQMESFATAAKAQIWTLAGPVPWAANKLENPRAVEPVRSEAELRNGSVTLLLQPFSIVQARFSSKH
jgi:Alpha-L-arabinofuranosidase C-terminus.